MQNIIISQEEIENLSHPYLYYKQRTNFLNNLKNNVDNEKKDVYKVTNISSLMQNHKKIIEKIKKQEKIEKSYLDPNKFETIFSENLDNQENEIRKNQYLKEKYYTEIFINPKIELEKIYDTDKNSIFNNEILLEGGLLNISLENNSNQTKEIIDNIEIKKINQLNTQINKLNLESKNLKNNSEFQIELESYNSEIVKKLSKNILSFLFTYFDEIFELFIDEIFEEEVIYLNELEEYNEKHNEIKNLKGIEKIDLLNNNSSYIPPILFNIINTLENFY